MISRFCIFLLLNFLEAKLTEKINEEQPNIIFVLVDDLGWSDVRSDFLFFNFLII